MTAKHSFSRYDDLAREWCARSYDAGSYGHARFDGDLFFYDDIAIAVLGKGYALLNSEFPKRPHGIISELRRELNSKRSFYADVPLIVELSDAKHRQNRFALLRNAVAMRQLIPEAENVGKEQFANAYFTHLQIAERYWSYTHGTLYTGKPFPNLHAYVLKHDPKWAGVLALEDKIHFLYGSRT